VRPGVRQDGTGRGVVPVVRKNDGPRRQEGFTRLEQILVGFDRPPHSPPSSPRKRGSSNPGAAVYWIPAFAGMTAPGSWSV
jgi:hypothetical protein